MQRTPGLSSVVVLIALLVFGVMAPDLQAQQMPAPPSPQELDQLLAPIALYPDSLLAQITTASTNPQEILDFDNWLAQNRNLSLTQLTAGAQQQGFDPAFIALAGFPDVVQMMAENIDDYAAIGAAVLANQDTVSQSIQRLRAQAYNSGALRSTPQQQVEVQPGPYYVIQPVNPNVVYVPQYDPTVIYAGSGLNAGLITFGIGIGITALLVSQPWGWGGWGWNWGSRRIYYNRGPWGGWGPGYRPPNYWYRPRPIQWSHRPGYGGNWGYRPPNYRPPRPINRPMPTRPGNRPGYRPPVNNRPIGGPRPPAGNRPPNNRPPNNGRPTIQPVPGPGRPGNRPQQRPTNTLRPAPQQRPQSQPRPGVQRPTAAPRPQPGARPGGGGPPGGGGGRPGGGGPPGGGGRPGGGGDRGPR